MTQSLHDPVLLQHIEDRNRHFAANQTAANAEHMLSVLQERADRYGAHVATMTISPVMVQWALSMATKYKSEYVKAHHYVADWFTALLILRYGEEPDAERSTDDRLDANGVRKFQGWPTRFSEQDMERANELLAGVKWPSKVFTLLQSPTSAEE